MHRLGRGSYSAISLTALYKCLTRHWLRVRLTGCISNLCIHEVNEMADLSRAKARRTNLKHDANQESGENDAYKQYT